MSGAYRTTGPTPEERAAINEYYKKLDAAFRTTQRDRDEKQDALISAYLGAVDKAVLYGDGKPVDFAPRFEYDPARFNAAMQRREKIMQRRRQIWELASGRVLSWAEFAELSGKTPEEVYKINLGLHSYGRRRKA